MPTFGSLFAGIGGIDLGLERAGWRGRWQVEYDPYCQRVLAKHWPDVARHGDVHDVHGWAACPLADTEGQSVGAGLREGEPGAVGGRRPGDGGGSCPDCLPYVDLIAGGFPCQPFSHAGKQLRLADDRWLWPEFERLVRELRPRYVLIENVPGLLADDADEPGGGMGAVLGGLADLGYDAEWESIPAAAVGAPHLRYRVWIVGYLAHADDVGGLGNGGLPGNGDASQWDDAYRRGRAAAVAYADGLGLGRQAALGSSGLTRLRPGEAGPEPDGASHGALADADLAGPQGHGRLDPERDCAGEWPAGSGGGTLDGQWLTEPDVGRVAHGVPARVDRLRALGNAVVPQVVEFIGRRILEAEAVS